MLRLRDGQGQSAAIHSEDYTAPAFWIDTVDLSFDLDPDKTRVLNRMTLRRNPDVPAQPLRLDGKDLNLARVLVGGQGTSFKVEGGQLILENLPEGNAPFELEIFTTCVPAKTTKPMGLYRTNTPFFTPSHTDGHRDREYTRAANAADPAGLEFTPKGGFPIRPDATFPTPTHPATATTSAPPGSPGLPATAPHRGPSGDKLSLRWVTFAEPRTPVLA